eukprot:1142097-Pelagomonas_calceolata.AAC.5
MVTWSHSSTHLLACLCPFQNSCSLARPQAELPTARSTPNPAPGAPGTPDTFRTVLRVAHHLFAPSYSFLEGSVGPDGKQISFSPEDKEALEKLRAEPALVSDT